MAAAQPADGAMSGAPAHDNWTEGMRPMDMSSMYGAEVREHDPSKTSIYTQGKLVRDGATGAPEAAVPLEGNSLNDLLKWSIGNTRDEDFEALRERKERGDFDPAAYREFLDTILGEGDVATMKKLLKAVTEEAGAADKVAGALEEIEYLVESIDNANDLLQIGGLRPVIACLRSTADGVAGAAAGVLATCVQNNPKAQDAALAVGLVTTLLELVRGCVDGASQARALIPRLLYVLSACVRGHEASARVLLDAGGIAQLVGLASAEDARTRRRTLFLLSALMHEAAGVAGALRAVPDGARTLLESSRMDDAEVQNHALACVLATMQGEAVDAAEREACREWWLAAGAVDELTALAARLAARLAAGDVPEGEDPTVPLQITKILTLLQGSEPLGGREPPVATAAAAPGAPSAAAPPAAPAPAPQMLALA